MDSQVSCRTNSRAESPRQPVKRPELGPVTPSEKGRSLSGFHLSGTTGFSVCFGPHAFFSLSPQIDSMSLYSGHRAEVPCLSHTHLFSVLVNSLE